MHIALENIVIKRYHLDHTWRSVSYESHGIGLYVWEQGKSPIWVVRMCGGPNMDEITARITQEELGAELARMDGDRILP